MVPLGGNGLNSHDWSRPINMAQIDSLRKCQFYVFHTDKKWVWKVVRPKGSWNR